MSLFLSDISSRCAEQPFFVYPWATNKSYGFGAVYSGFVRSLSLCILKGIGFRFVQINKPSGIALTRGYEDFFLPFCQVASGPLLERLNRDPLPYQAKLPLIKELVSGLLRHTTEPSAKYFLFSSQISRLPNVHLPPAFASYQHDEFLLRAEIANALWLFQPDVENHVRELVSSLPLPVGSSEYLSVVIRRGDKILESNYASLDLYVQALDSFRAGRLPIFLASDDLSCVKELEKRLPACQCFYLPPPFQHGYNNDLFRSLPAASRREALLRFLAQVEIMRRSRTFFATRTTNVSYMVNTLRRGQDVVWVD